MVRAENYEVDKSHLGGTGVGTARMQYWLQDEELPPHLRMIATVTVPVGGSIGLHTHDGEAEIYRILSGTGLYDDNGTPVEVGPGFTTICYDSQKHGLTNVGSVPLILDAVIISG